MKKVLLTTTALVMTAGVAAAEVSISGTAGVAAVKSADATARMTSGVDLNFAVSAAADNGLTMAATVDLGEGELVDYNDDFAVDSQCATAEVVTAAVAETATVNSAASSQDATCGFVGSSSSPAITLGYAGVTVVVDAGGVDDLYDDAQHDDISINMDLAGLDTTITMDTDAADSHGSYKVAYTMGDLTATLSGSTDPGSTAAATALSATAGDALEPAVAARSANDHSGGKLALSYAMGDLTLNASTDDNGTEKSTNTAGFSYAMDAITITYTLANTAEEGWKDYDAKLAYSAGAMTASIATDEAGVSKVIAEYDLGGGATFFASSKSTKGTNNQQAAGINFKF
jgi:outer membrane protein OmpU